MASGDTPTAYYAGEAPTALASTHQLEGENAGGQYKLTVSWDKNGPLTNKRMMQYVKLSSIKSSSRSAFDDDCQCTYYEPHSSTQLRWPLLIGRVFTHTEPFNQLFCVKLTVSRSSLEREIDHDSHSTLLWVSRQMGCYWDVVTLY